MRRKDAAPVTANGESFTAARHHMIRSMANSRFTATSSLEAITAAGDAAARTMLHTLNVPGRQRHPSGRRKPGRNSRTSPRPRRPSPGNPGSPCSRRAFPSPLPRAGNGKEEPAPGSRDLQPWNRAPSRRDTRAEPMPPHKPEPGIRERSEHGNDNISRGAKHLKSTVLRYTRAYDRTWAPLTPLGPFRRRSWPATRERHHQTLDDSRDALYRLPRQRDHSG
jgi:hypothetical protein